MWNSDKILRAYNSQVHHAGVESIQEIPNDALNRQSSGECITSAQLTEYEQLQDEHQHIIARLDRIEYSIANIKRLVKS